jgi:hypothetical protein
MNKVIAFFLLVLLQSCQFFDKKVPDENELLEQELKKINWEQVDEFPSFTACDSLSDTYSKQTCFYETLSSQLHSKLKDDSIAKLFPQLDTIQVKIIISSNSDVNFEAIISDSIAYNKIQLDSIFQLRLTNFPKINPAVKRGVPVKSEFQMPVVLQKED